jgi:hypothetical protein
LGCNLREEEGGSVEIWGRGGSLEFPEIPFAFGEPNLVVCRVGVGTLLEWPTGCPDSTEMVFQLCGFVEEPLAGKERGGYRAAANCYGGYFQVPMAEGDDKPDGGPHGGRTGWVGVVPFNRLHGFKENLQFLVVGFAEVVSQELLLFPVVQDA